jgi:hypothetical protein
MNGQKPSAKHRHDRSAPQGALRRSAGSFAARTCIASAKAATVIPMEMSGIGVVPGRSTKSQPGGFIDDLEQHAPREIAHDFLVEIPPSGRFRDAP